MSQAGGNPYGGTMSSGGGFGSDWFQQTGGIQQASNPGVVPQGGSPYSSQGQNPTMGYSPSGNPFSTGLGKGQYAISPLEPNLTADFSQYLRSMIGMGASPYDLSAILPSSGGTTGAGQLTAPNNELLQALEKFFTGGGASSVPGLNTLQEMSQTGDPISALPAWNAMTEAQQRQIQQNAAQLKEQFAFTGNLASSPMATGMSDYFSQTSKDQNALLAGMQQQALESAMGRKLGAGEYLGTQGAQLASFLQGLDQASIDRLLQEFIRTRPEYSPLLGLQGSMASTFPPTYGGSSTPGLAGTIVGGMSDLISAIYPQGIQGIPGAKTGG